MAKAKLTDEVKTYIVQALACFDSPSIVASAVKKEFGVEVSRQLVESHDPNKKAASGLAPKWRVIFEETRKTFLEDTASIAISHRAVRLRALQRMADKAENQGNMALASSLLKQAAEEVGGSYTNRRELTGKDGKDLPVPVSPVTIFQLPDNGRS
ncbi:DUF2280 domain-containing protein [Rhizobium leguminosarum]|uniref:DUF2280 domain-containing protein n=1 Tax=Rhizobium leguminosarum bv. viciae TaxID=387 RepID=A0A7G6RJA6_RHILV|nr:DUF2280 domain-containing protein [Rhizobium leguminosarum]ASS57593.1 hypothetical protein CHR56_25245 [Rhizobium leguminosarum bv. viciae]QND42338.1 DUF2280 domain-containing protein [Rhizobium leguminosarum bv. viciae]TBY17485.1 DUF2280 domain-containing protein [Rhizobium leguminosarum bv. viciae]TBY24626.1 DUF2280 domain-containing protein [Rhizobium leguminosarum bv. viciae]TBY99710.1 DUF2280 domain-containing protein [Rhizobium leguminosarum bv. viciae]